MVRRDHRSNNYTEVVDDLIPILFEYNTTDFSTHGIGDLTDCIECVCEQDEEGAFEMSFTYPVTGELLGELTIGRLVYAKVNPWQNPQIFRIYGYEKEIGGKIQINCQHISYDLCDVPVKVFKSAKNANANTALADVKTNSVSVNGFDINKFTFSSNVIGTAQRQEGYFEVDTPTSVRAAILDGDDSIKGCFGGDLVFDNYNLALQAMGGEDRGVTIEYGVDLIDLNQEENISEMITGVLPFFTYTVETNSDDDDGQRFAYGDIQYASGTFITHKISPLDLTSYFPDQAEHTAPSAAQLNSKAQEWMAAEDGFGEPEINLTLSYATFGQDVRLYDAVTGRFVKMGIDVKSKVHSYKYDVLNERVTEVEVGKTKSSFLFNLEDASRLKKGLLPPERIKNHSITSEKYAAGSVGGSALAAGGVGGGAIAPNSITEEKMADNSITSRAVQDDTIKVYHIENGAIVTDKISVNAVTTDKVLNKATTYAKSQYQGTLDQVGINKSDIAAINALFANTIYCGNIQASGWMRTPRVILTEEYVEHAAAARVGWVNSNFAWSSHTHSGYAPSSHSHSNYATNTALNNAIRDHVQRYHT